MNRVFRGAALFVALTCAVWVAVLWRWEVTSRDMSTRDIVIYLAVLPVTAFAFVLLLRWASRGAVQRQAAAIAAAAAGAAAPPAGKASAIADAPRHASVQLIAASLACAAGTSAGELQAAAKEGTPRPALDPELRDDEGLPVFTARIAALDPATSTPPLESLIESTRALQSEWAGLVPSDHTQRALAALQEPLLQAVAALAPWGACIAEQANPNPTRCVQVLIGLPSDWTPFEHELGRVVAAETVAAAEPSTIPARCFDVTAHTGDDGEELLLQADRMLQALAGEQRNEPVIVAACDSTIGKEALDALERDGLLFSSSKRPKGRIPGEAAAALVLAGADWPAAASNEQPVPRLHRPVAMRRDKSVDAPGRVGSDIALDTMTRAVTASGLVCDAIGSLVCDADQHTPRGIELHGAALSLLPHLDGAEDIRLLGTVTGRVGAVSALLVVACAAECAKASGKPSLAVTLGDPFARLALVVLPNRPHANGELSASAAPTEAS